MKRVLSAVLLATLISGAVLADDVSGRRMVWAHYVPWYTPDNASQISYRFHSFPQTEVEEKVFRAEIERALAQGIDGFFNDMVAHKGGATSYWDLRPFLKAAEGTPFQFGICLDAKTTVEHQVKELVKMLSSYGDHPNYPKWGDRYVVDTYTFLRWTPDEWRAIRKGCEDAGYPIYVIANVETGFSAFDANKLKPYAGTFERAYHFAHYGMDQGRFKSMERETEECAKFCEANGAVYMPCVWPGYYGAWMAGFNCFYQPFLGFDMALRRFDTWRLVKNADWLHITTYNDHGETAMMPRRHVTGNKAIVKAMSDEFKGAAPSRQVDVQFAYLREVMPGTMLRFEAMRLPSAAKGEVTVAGVLRDAQGRIVGRLDEKSFKPNGWDRLEWLISTTEISATPYLAPEFIVREGTVRRTVRPPKVFLVTGWLENPVTIKASVDDYAVITNRLDISWSDGLLRARCAFIADTMVKRAVLFRNNRPLTTFQSNAGKTLNVYFRGGNDVGLKVGNGRVVQAVKSFERNGTRDFAWDEKRIISRRTPGWMLMSARIEAEGTDELTFSSSGKSATFTPLELTQKGVLSVDAGKGKIWLDADGTTYDLPSLDAARGEYAAEVWTEKPEANDAYWVEFELADGRIAESDVLYPFAVSIEPVEMNVVETPITLDHTSGASGAPDTVEFFTPKSEWPVKETRVVKAKVSPQSIRRRMFAKGQKVPARCWPMGSFRLQCEIVPSVEDGKNKVMLSPGGWNEGPSLILLKDGRLKATYASAQGPQCEVVSGSSLQMGQKASVVLKSDCKRLSLEVDGVPQGVCEVPVMRVYGNCAPVVSSAVEALEFSADSGATIELRDRQPVSTISESVIELEGAYPGHLQDVWMSADAIWWAQTEYLVKSDRTGRVLGKAHVGGHHAGLAMKDGRLFSAVCAYNGEPRGKTTPQCHVMVGEYDANDLSLITMHVLDINDRAGSICILPDGTYVIGCLRHPALKPTEVKFHHVGEDFKLIETHVVDVGRPVKLGIEVIRMDGDDLCLFIYNAPMVRLDAKTFAVKGFCKGLDGCMGFFREADFAWIGVSERMSKNGSWKSCLVRKPIALNMQPMDEVRE